MDRHEASVEDFPPLELLTALPPFERHPQSQDDSDIASPLLSATLPLDKEEKR